MGHPPPHRSVGLLFCFLLLLTSTVNADKCNVGCHGMQPGKSHQEGQVYTYELEGKAVTSVSEAQGEATMKLTATVELAAKPNCVRQVRLKNVQINGAPATAQDLEKHALQFNYHDGHIDNEICAEPGDSQDSLNIKRAVVSLFQSAVLQEDGATTHSETDVFGSCPTDFTFHKDGESLVVNKYKNLAQCFHRENIGHGLISASLNPKSGIQASPALASSQRIEQRYKRGVLNKASSTETYKYRPFSNGDAGAKTIVETTLTLKGQKADASSATVSTPKSLIFDSPHPVARKSAADISNALKAVKAEETGDVVQPQAADRFSELVRVMRSSSKADIQTAYNQAKATPSDKKIMLDALYRTGTGEAAELAVELIKSGDLTPVEALMYYANLALVHHVNLGAVTAVSSLLDQPDLPRVGYLGVGHVIGKYCEQHTCDKVPEVKAAVDKLMGKVGDGKAPSRDKEDVIVTALRAAGNARQLDDANLQKIANIAADKKVRNRVRAMAISTLPTKCSMKWKSVLLKTLADRQEDSEIRIKAYLALVACPCATVANQLKEILDKETVNQVGSFIQSHLRNLRASADRNKDDAKRHLGQIRPSKKFPEDFRIYSFNNELSYSIEALGAGSAIENNVIFSQNSWVPRSTTLNLTTELFGRSFNFMELDTRVENLDRIIESFVGSKGVLEELARKDDDETDKYVDEKSKKVADFVEYVENRIGKSRGKREVKPSETEKFGKGVHLRNNEVDQLLDLDMSLKLFGVELAYLSYSGNDDLKGTPKGIFDRLMDNFDKVADKAKAFDYNMENHLHFLDADLIYPTGMGMPLVLGLTGSSVVHLKTSGKVDLQAILKNPENAAMRIALEPSASVRVAGDLVVEAFGQRSGLRVVGTLHTATGSDISVKLLEGQGIDINFGIPKRKQDLISISTDVLLTTDPKTNKMAAPKFTSGRDHSDCFDQFSGLIGLTVCGHIKMPYDGLETLAKRPFFPLSGPSKFALTIENNDVTSYHFKAFYNNKKPKSRSLEILLETPNSRQDRRVALTAEAGLEPNKFAKVSFASPLKSASGEITLKDNDKEYSVTLLMKNDQTEYFGRVGIEANGKKYTPVLEYRVPDHIEKLSGGKGGKGQQYKIEGDVDVADEDGGKRYKLNKVVLVSGDKKLVHIDGSAFVKPQHYGVDFKIGQGDESGAIKFDLKRPKPAKYEMLLEAKQSKDPNAAIAMTWDYERQPDKLDNKLTVTHGADLKSETNRITLEQHFDYNMKKEDLRLSAKNKLSYPARDLLFDTNGELTRNSIDGDVNVKFDKFKMNSKLKAKTGTQKPGDYEGEFEIKVMDNGLEAKAKRTVIGDHQSKFENSLQLTPGGKYKADATITYNVKPKDIDVKLDGDLDLNGKKLKVDTALVANLDKVNSHAMVNLDGTKYLDFDLKAQRAPNPSGNFRLNLKNLLSTDGKFSMQSSKGSGEFNVDLPKFNRKIKGTGDIQITGTKHAANVEVNYDTKDPSKKIKLATVTDITKNSIDSKNVLEVLTYKTEFNVKGKGKFEQGEFDGEADVTTPDNRHVVLRAKRSAQPKDDKMDVQAEVELIDFPNKSEKASRSVHVKADAKQFDRTAKTFNNLDYDVKVKDLDGRDANVQIRTKHQKPDPAKRTTEVGVTANGALLPKPLEFQLTNELNNDQHKWDVKTSLGSDLSATGTSSYTTTIPTEKPSTWTYKFDVKLPSDKLRNIKGEGKESLLAGEDLSSSKLDYSNSHSLTYNDDQNVNIETTAKYTPGTEANKQQYEGTGTFAIQALKIPKLTVGGNFKHNPSGEKQKLSGAANVKYGDVETSASLDSDFLPDMSVMNIDAKANLPLEKLKKVNLKVGHKREKEGVVRKTDVTLNVDNEKYTLAHEVQLDPNAPKISAIFTSPTGKSELMAKANKLGEREYTGEWKLDSPKGFVIADFHVNLESVDDFVVNVNFDSDKIKDRKIHVEIANKPSAKSGKKIQVTVTSDGKNIITGSTNYKKRDEDGKIIVEGSGTLKVGENTRSSSFKYTRKQLTREVDGEVGVAILLNANFDPSAIVGELKMSNKELHVFNSYCEQSKDCAHFKLQSLLDTEQRNKLNHQITVDVDLKKFNVPVEFGLKTGTKYQDYNFDHTASLYLHSKDKTQYTYQVYVHPKESAAILSLPTRELAVIGSVDLPKTKQTGAYKLDASVYLDRKNKPTEKTSISVNGDVNIDKSSATVNGEARFTYPQQPKEMIVKGKMHYGGENSLDANLDIDVFAKKQQKITLNAKIQREQLPNGFKLTTAVDMNSRGQALKVEYKDQLTLATNEVSASASLAYNDRNQKPKSIEAKFSLTPKAGHASIQALNKNIVKYDSKMDLSKGAQKYEAEYELLDYPALKDTFEAKDYNSFKLEHQLKDGSKKATYSGRIVLGQLVELHAEAMMDGKKMKFASFLLALDEKNFMKPEVTIEKENINKYLQFLRDEGKKMSEKLQAIGKEGSEEFASEMKDFAEHLKKAKPDMKPLLDYYVAEMTKLKDELHADQTIKEIQATLNKVFGGVFQAVAETMKEMIKRGEELYHQLQTIIEKTSEALKATWPQIQESIDRIVKSAMKLCDALAQLAQTYLNALLNIINEHQKELKELAALVSELTHDIAKILFKGIGQIEKDVKDFVAQIVEQIRALPISELIKEKYEEFVKFQVPEAVLQPIDELFKAIKAFLPTAEMQEFATALYNYIIKHVKREKVDDVSEIKRISGLAVNAAQSIVAHLQSPTTIDNALNYVQMQIPFDLSIISKLPGITTIKVSLVSLIRNGELPSPLDLYYTYRPQHYYLEQVIPPFDMSGVVADGGHFFSFDGRHVTLPGSSCNYILAQDMLDGNFSVVASFKDGTLTSVTITEPKESMTLKADGSITVNGKPADYPAQTENLEAFLTYAAVANVKSHYGVHVMCARKAPMFCSIRVDGFYFGRLRGLLGDGNNEPWDDFTLPNGKVTESDTEFGNAYKLGKCANVNAVKHESVERTPVCTEYFASASSSMSNCFNYVSPHHYRDACDSAVHANQKHAACLISGAYYVACRQARITTSIPPACAKCKAGDKEVAVGENFDAKIPKKEADIILVVEQNAKNEKLFGEMLMPLVTELRSELKQQGLTDVHIGIIGFGDKMEWPQHYTVNGKTNIEGEVKNMKFDKGLPEVTYKEAQNGTRGEKRLYLKKLIDTELGTFKLTEAYEEAVRYPFRAGAAKSVIGVIATSCEKSPLPVSLQQLRLIVGQRIYRTLGLTYNHISFLGDVMVSGKPQKNVVGYNSDSAYTFADSKKKPLEGSSEMKSNLEISSKDVCAGFAVASGGAAFNSGNFLEAKANQRKQFVQVVARSVSEQLANTEIEADCQCRQEGGYRGRPTCSIVSRKEKDSKTRA